MAIVITTSPEPLSRRALAGAPTILIRSGASRLLTQELRSYWEGQITGRSFLIAGHRGAGKTTMVAAAVMNVQRAAAQSTLPMLRPLFVPLHGPNLFRDEPIARTEPAAGSTEKP